MSKRVLVYPCGTEIGLEVFKSVCNSIHFDLFGGSSSYDHGRFVYGNHIDNLPFITDYSDKENVREFISIIKNYGFDYIYPAMDGVLLKFAEYRDCFPCNVIAPATETVRITRSKKETYKLFADLLVIPKVYESDVTLKFPVFVKPDVGQGASGTAIVHDNEELTLNIKTREPGDYLLLEYLPGEEYTIDCFTNSSGDLVYMSGRARRRVKGGISVNAVRVENSEFRRIAEVINSNLKFQGAWFFQLKENRDGRLALLEIAPRIAGGSALARCYGANLPLMTLHLFNGQLIDSVLINDYELELDRALHNRYRNSIKYSHVYVDFDDTLLINGRVNLLLIAFLYQCVNDKIPVTLLTRRKEALQQCLYDHRLESLFDNVITLGNGENKSEYIKETDAIFIDDS
ncbi:MAG: ATP-grasp domain-containing protein, partial [Synergistota bacterium]|nr:ATP-grasp domain-containing protein [Synergistota bacterium]